jgi:hypothetical protein|tara:strand:+ start:1850 stop:2128 length:279 start_codon:yes stop_codon:yes gene_type:complete
MNNNKTKDRNKNEDKDKDAKGKKLQIKPDTEAFIALSEEITYKGQKQRVDRDIESLHNRLIEEHEEYMAKVARICTKLKHLKMVSKELSFRI